MRIGLSFCTKLVLLTPVLPEIVLKSLAFLEWQELVFFVVERPRVTEPSEVLHSFQPSNSKNNTSRNSQTNNASHRKFENAILLKQS